MLEETDRESDGNLMYYHWKALVEVERIEVSHSLAILRKKIDLQHRKDEFFYRIGSSRRGIPRVGGRDSVLANGFVVEVADGTTVATGAAGNLLGIELRGANLTARGFLVAARD